jgi:hypothetical protein
MYNNLRARKNIYACRRTVLFYILFIASGVGLSPLYCGYFWPIVPAPDDIATLSTTNPTWPDPGSNPGRRGEKPATNRLSYGAALVEQ